MSTFRRNIPSLSALVTLESAARLLSFTEAARELNVTQPAVSRQIRDLEKSLGFPLFIRRHRSLDLTPKGRQMADALTQSIEHIVNTWLEIKDDKAGGHLRMSAYVAFSNLWLAPRLSLFRAENPDLSIVIETRDQDTDLRSGEFDIALRFGNGQWPDGEATFLFRDNIVPVCSPGYFETGGPITNASDLRTHRIIDYSRGGKSWQGWPDWTRFAFGETPDVRVDTYYSYYMDAVTAAVEGQGVLLGWKAIIEKYLAAGALIPISDRIMESSSAHYVVVRRDRPVMGPAEKFRTWIVAVCERYPLSERM
ncbi:LysR substrate-binding domain-containing protein [Microvirga vignae]|uniref:LysR substrate-binding domain-containing protein n=1 Tax=Microvirga vignae TaxID=1225564 RepID=UPI000A02BD8A|nr:LysR substrate-binding domain-containing protein [Microvirga vignae]